jgi:hypothetical protein
VSPILERQLEVVSLHLGVAMKQIIVDTSSLNIIEGVKLRIPESQL